MDYLIHLAIICSIYAIVAIALNLCMGYTGLVSITHAAFFGIGAYATAILTTDLNWNFFLTLPIGVLLSAAAAFIFTRLVGRLSGDYFMLVTVGFNYVVTGIMINWQSVTHGPIGISGIPRPSVFGFIAAEPAAMLLIGLVVLLLCYLVSAAITRSSLGRVLKAIREDESAIRVFGYETVSYKAFIFMVSAGIAALAGSLLASYLRFVSPSTFTVIESIFVLAMVVFGGMANLRGSLLGALLLTILLEGLRFAGFSAEFAGHARQLTYGLILVLFMLYRPKGLIGEYKL